MAANIPLPPASRNQSPDEHMQISRRFIKHAREELEKGERLQASEKVWGAAGHALAAIGKERGWVTGTNEHKEQIALHLAREFGNPSIRTRFNAGYRDEAHGNFHRNDQPAEAVKVQIEDVEIFVDQLQQFRQEGPQPFTVDGPDAAARITALTGRKVKIGETYTDGFVNRRRLSRYQRQWNASKPDDSIEEKTEGGPE